MAKRPTITDISSGFTSSATLDGNFDNIAAQFDNTVSRDGSTPNQMEADLDLNSNDLLNVNKGYFDAVYVSGTILSANTGNLELLLVPVTTDIASLSGAAASMTYLRTAGYAEVGDGGASLYKKVNSEPSHSGKVQSADGSWWELVSEDGKIYAEQFGAFSSNTYAANDTALTAAISALGSVSNTLSFATTGTYLASALTVSTNGVTLEIPSGVVLENALPTTDSFMLTWSGTNGTICGGGTIDGGADGIADYDVTLSGIVRADVNVTGDDFQIKNIQLLTPSRCSVFINKARRFTASNCWGNGGFPSASYNPASTTAHFAFFYDPPDSGDPDLPLWTDLRFTQFISAIGAGNLSGGTAGYCPTLTNSRFWDCWDHAAYFSAGATRCTVANCVTYDVRKPFVVTGEGCVIDNVQCYATGTGSDWHEQALSLRDCSYSKVTNVHLEGDGAYIDCSTVNGGAIDGNQFKNITLVSTAEGEFAGQLRIKNTSANTTSRNVIDTVTVESVSADLNDIGLIMIEGSATGGFDNKIINCQTLADNNMAALVVKNVTDTEISGNVWDVNGYDAGSAEDYKIVKLRNADRAVLKGNRYKYQTGGTDVDVYGIDIDSNCLDVEIQGEKFQLDSGSLADFIYISDSGTDTRASGNHYRLGDPLKGETSWTTGAQLVINNENMVPTAKTVGAVRVRFTPQDQNAMDEHFGANGPVYLDRQPNDPGSSPRFLLVQDGAVAATGSWFWEIDG
jgi:hypothetical protein